MEPRKLTAIMGCVLVISGLCMMVAQFIWHEHFLNMFKELNGLEGVGLKTNVPGFAVIVVGAVLLLAGGIKKIEISD